MAHYFTRELAPEEEKTVSTIENKTEVLMNHVDFQLLFDRIGVPIDVVYNPEYEKSSNYVPSILPLRYDAFIYLAHTTAFLTPITHFNPEGHQMPETYSFGV
jgi:erythromycin esterase-like protein